MSKTMLIDATHTEETRVVVLNGQQNGNPRVEEFDFESLSRKQLRGNIYLAKVTRVEPSLQAAFVEYGGNRHGFLAFNEIHPDYYQIPVADREKLMAELAAQAQANNGHAHDDDSEDEDHEDEGDDLPDEERRLRQHLIRRYKIQEVIKRRQILLVQVVKEERGNKGAALTTYLSLAGRYCVLMPNTARGGGISRKITNAADRKRLKSMVQSLDVPHGMGLIVRTAGAKRTKQEIKRDYDYLLRVWETIRETTLRSNAPALIYEEEDLVKRAIRDMFDKDFAGVLVEGEEGYKSARDFMRMIMPSQAKKIQPYRANSPLFARYGVEDMISKIYSPVVALKSGGYLVINQTEALVAIDVNSGKSTKERNIEATALKTNLEAAEEAARQMRLRDLAGLVVIDFIDMDEPKNNRAVEKKLKDALAEDRARIQMGKISGFGLMEISRQRRRTGFLEGTTVTCPHCEGMGRVRSVDSAALSAMRRIDMEAMQNGAGAITVKLPMTVALYILNEKQAHLAKLRTEWGLKVNIEVDTDLGHTDLQIIRTVTADEVDFTPPVRPEPVAFDFSVDVEDEEEDEEDEEAIEREDTDDDEASARVQTREDRDDGEGGRRGKRRRRRRGGRDGGRERGEGEAEAAADSAAEDGDDEDGEEDDGDFRRNGRGRRRRGRRGGRRAGFESRPREPYGWVRARTPSLEAPYVWIDPFEEQQQQQAARPARPAVAPMGDVAGVAAAGAIGSTSTAPVVNQPLGAENTQPTSLVPDDLRNQPAPKRARPPRKGRNVVTTEEAPAEPVATEAAPLEAVEAELPPVEVRARPKRSRKKAEVAEAVEPTETVVADVAEPVVARPARATRSRKKAAETPSIVAAQETDLTALDPVIVAPEPALAVAKELETVVAEPAPAAIDPNDISSAAPPEKPKRGWWKR
ncbi:MULTISPECIES: ribonuclease E/G [Asticcacaulis]|uniref:Rne/Rng family ribonuclease n=1 Tax=Asticcacaulis TaxID=76890 RepID=UPI001AE41D67|nr:MULTISPECIES: ribonuclease E/G [Asticcacaulis]MBP2158170.1 ribonuclease E [Asticcacaulis solisilvae]MDR6799215.1 ribonuclease E [Asticcacaulis sp. BE141]